MPYILLLVSSSPHMIDQVGTTTQIPQVTINMSDPSETNATVRPPVYFLSIGGPNFMENKQHPAFVQLGTVGREITEKVKPKTVVVFSAHWQGGTDKIKINVAEQTDIIYDFCGFPPHYYKYKYPNKGSPELAEKIIQNVWVGFMAAFDPKTDPLNVPLVQVSLYGNEDTDRHYLMGQALESLRDEGILIIGAGMAVHNLFDYRATRGSSQVMPYTSSFDVALREAATVSPKKRQATISALMKRHDAQKAHPTLEHVLPLYVAAGAAGLDSGEEISTFLEGSLSWAQYQFGKVATV
ncbi:putative aromatic ring-opening dioxygenase LigB subunit [Polychaeton citri CBS 116435]|uniref:Aromatic ring-opening dioxygenase LigB subunit n=1 Tax=Polychaeton citri CBS 116435 TaxID=1314669 RepID=A0A9P4UJG4_9PEZI|nr:putative aromatic ring-opening dioxygenase LigB subunit [Polychaeton citri CBS 116435]